MAVFTYNPGTDRGNVRLIISDTDETNYIFTDKEIDQFLNITQTDGKNEVRLAAAMALETLATSEARIQKKLRMHDLQTDGPALAESLRKSAKMLRDEVENEDAFGIAEINMNPWNAYQIIINDDMRD